MTELRDNYLRGTELFGGATETNVRVTTDGELGVTSTEREKNVWAHYDVTGVAATAYAIMVDLSDTTTFPHDQTGRIDVSAVGIQVDGDNTATGTIKLGVITRIDGTDADIEYFDSVIFSKTAGRFVEKNFNYAPSQIKLSVAAGTVDRGITNDVENNVAAVNTGLTLPSPNGNITPAVGDMIMRFGRTAGTSAQVTTLYHSEA